MTGMHEKMFNWPKEFEEAQRIQQELSEHDIHVPQIEEIRLIRGADGEDYVNVNDLYTMMKIMACKLFPSLSVMLFIKAVIHEFIPARR